MAFGHCLMIVTEEVILVACIPHTSITVAGIGTSITFSLCIAINWATVTVLMIVTGPLLVVAFIPYVSADISTIASVHLTRHCL